MGNGADRLCTSWAKQGHSGIHHSSPIFFFFPFISMCGLFFSSFVVWMCWCSEKGVPFFFISFLSKLQIFFFSFPGFTLAVASRLLCRCSCVVNCHPCYDCYKCQRQLWIELGDYASCSCIFVACVDFFYLHAFIIFDRGGTSKGLPEHT